jgi:AAA15 family ATPase/GTPase
MRITELSVSNFRSFERLDLELNTFNVLIGANASGKSNFVEIFKFLRDIAKHGLQNAVSMQGGLRISEMSRWTPVNPFRYASFVRRTKGSQYASRRG